MTDRYSSTGPTPEPFTGDRFQILSLDGGGAKALFSASVLARFEEDHGVRVVDRFDLIAGTSAGGIVALGLGAGLSPAEIADRYLELIAKVFPRSRQRKWRPSRLVRPSYSGEALREVLVEVFGDRLLGESSKRLLVPSWDVQSGEVHLFKTPHSDRLVRDWNVKMVDVALATSAAPTYFPAATVDSARLIDGGVFANNPSVFAIGEAKSMLGVQLDSMRVLSIGTMSPFTDHSDRLDNAGIGRWASAAVDTILTASSDSSTGLARHLIGFGNFVRLNATVQPGLFALDRIDAAKVAGYAATVSRNLSPEYAAKFIDHTAAPYSPPPGRGGAVTPRAEEQS
ncbi:patatin-like phospholipase family protein [Phytoactinopolyspora alkaliphila]|uniref:Patatin-like phospholipase family protein n=2 Tax=Phytoactinopolyspora alkaliphila TaxID=1783498 RepID=A0A6N9YPG5_9ACTN|nr:CBASS cGAMP-activated phospholipase [Phytoactinopolyspora alkaliphila]NED96864.1 patatin-like phospholipase family protein [Phytoactinopolyspora alkaliphila]